MMTGNKWSLIALRLNCIEFFNWSLPDEGRLFKAFAKKARQP